MRIETPTLALPENALYAAAQIRRIARVSAGRVLSITLGVTAVANSKVRRRALPTGWSAATILVAAACVAPFAPAMAAMDLSAGATIGVEHDSNPIQLSNSQSQAFEAAGFITGQSDTAKRLTANVAAVTGVNGPFHLQLQGLYTRVDYDRFDALDHTEYNVGGNLDWKPSQVFDVSLLASQSVVPLGLNDFGGQQIVQQTTRQAEGTLRLRPTPRWQLSLTPSWFDKKIPLPAAQDFELSQSTGSAAFDYLGAGPLVPGLFITESHGSYSGIANANRYQQQAIGGSLNYKVSQFSTFSLLAGHTRRTTHLTTSTSDPLALALEGTQQAFTGTLAYQRQLSVKTSISLGAFRDFQQYYAYANPTVGTGFTVGAAWKPTPKLSATLDSRFAWSTIDGVQVGAAVGDRRDLTRSFSLGIKYLATQRVSLRSYLTRQVRNSTVRFAVFDETIAGLELTATID